MPPTLWPPAREFQAFADGVLSRDRHLPADLEQNLETAEMILVEVIGKAPSLVNFEATGATA